MKYKFRLSYKENHKLVPVELEKINILTGLNCSDIKTIDELTTKFENIEDFLNYLKQHELIPENIEKLYITFDSKTANDIIMQQLYAYNKTIFYKKDIDKLKYSYIYKIIMHNIENGEYISKIIEHYKRKYVYKNFTTLESLARIVKDNGISSISNNSKQIYVEEIEKLLNFVFYKKNGKKNYKNIRDFICYISGEEPIIVKKDKKTKNIKKEQNNYILKSEENISLKEWYIINENIANNARTFEPYQDGNDYICPITSEEIEESLNEYARKLTLKRDNGEYE